MLSWGPEDVKDYWTEDVLKMTCSLRWYYNLSLQNSEKIKHYIGTREFSEWRCDARDYSSSVPNGCYLHAPKAGCHKTGINVSQTGLADCFMFRDSKHTILTVFDIVFSSYFFLTFAPLSDNSK